MSAERRRNGGMLYLQIVAAFVFGVGALLLGLLGPPPNGLGWLVVLIEVAMILTGLGGVIHALARTRGGAR
jgi:hypothetical protein